MFGLKIFKIFAALAIAVVLFGFAGFASTLLLPETSLDKPAYQVAGVSGDANASAGPKVKIADPISDLIASADPSIGAKISRQCAACHSFDKGGVNKIGPNLWNVVMREKGQVDGFSYSSSLLAKGGNWDYAALNQFLWKPKSYINGTKMNFAGIKNNEKRAAMIAWIRDLADNPADFPSKDAIAAEKLNIQTLRFGAPSDETNNIDEELSSASSAE